MSSCCHWLPNCIKASLFGDRDYMVGKERNLITNNDFMKGIQIDMRNSYCGL